MARKPDLPCADCGKLLWSSKTSLPPGQARCRGCRRANRSRKHGRSGYGYGCRCEICRAGQAAAMRDYAERFRERTGRPLYQKYKPVKSKTCRRCGRARAKREFCHRCQLARDVRQRAVLRKAERAAAGTAGNPHWPWVQGTCAHCRKPFVRRAKPSPYCSTACRRKDSPKGGFISRGERLAIYERDGWTCQLCFEPVDANLHYLDDWAASLDHIVPQSHMLFPDHSPSNLRLAHRWCNSVRGDGSHECASIFAA